MTVIQLLKFTIVPLPITLLQMVLEVDIIALIKQVLQHLPMILSILILRAHTIMISVIMEVGRIILMDFTHIAIFRQTVGVHLVVLEI